MSDAIQIVTKADHRFYPGLTALLASVRHQMPVVPLVVVDCGLRKWQKEACRRFGVRLVDARLENYALTRAEDKNRFSTAIFGFFSADWDSPGVTIHLDADVILLETITGIVIAAREAGIAATADHPPLTLSSQIRDQQLEAEVSKLIPDYNGMGIAFNAGIFAVQRDYFRSQLNPLVQRLHPYHNRLWGKDQAILNLAAAAANPVRPYLDVGRTYNVRPRYTRDPSFLGVESRFDGSRWHASAHGGPVRALHFVGEPKPWQPGYPASCRLRHIWDFYSQRFAELAESR